MTEPFVDYYALLGITRSASPKEIQQAVKRAIRTWSKQTARPELEKRQQAERKLQQIKQAREELLDPGRRRQYDEWLATAALSGGLDRDAPSAAEGWLDLARRSIEMDDFRTAARAAQEAASSADRTAELWSILARANAGLGRFDDAVFEAQRALQLDPDNMGYRYNLAETFERAGDWNNALRAYHDLADRDRASILPELGVASVYLSSGDTDVALPRLRELLARGTDAELVGDYLAMGLATAAERIPRVQHASGYSITDGEEIARMRPLLHEALAVTSDPQLRADISETLRYVDYSAGREFLWRRLFGRWARTYALVSVVLLCCSGVIDAFAQNGLFAVALIGVVAGGAGLVFYAFVPRWKLRQTDGEYTY
jgi:curved DNA-binding protein CbpA